MSDIWSEDRVLEISFKNKVGFKTDIEKDFEYAINKLDDRALYKYTISIVKK